MLAIMATLGVEVVLTTPCGCRRRWSCYSARHYGQEPAFEAFTKETGIEIKSFGGNDSELFERLRAEGDKTPADVLISVDAGNLWNAAHAGLLAAIDAPALQSNIPAHLRDPQNRWFGSHRPRPNDYVQYPKGQARGAVDL